MEQQKQLWVDKYRPNKLEDYVLNIDIKSYFKNMISNHSLLNFTLAGIQGSGKTTLAKILCNEFNAEVLFIKCATEGSVDTLRSKVEPFCNALTFDGRIKIVVLDEIDSASSSSGIGSSFQMGLRTLIEAAQDDCRFILTCNYINKVIPAVLSRCPLIPLKFDQRDLLIYIKRILEQEKIKYEKSELKKFIIESFHFYPDCRRIINYLQFCCNSGELVVKLNSTINSEKIDFIKNIVSKIKTEDILEIRKFYLQTKDNISDFIDAGSNLFNYVVDNDIITEDGILKLTELLYELNVVIDKEPTFFGMLISIKKFKK